MEKKRNEEEKLKRIKSWNLYGKIIREMTTIKKPDITSKKSYFTIH